MQTGGGGCLQWISFTGRLDEDTTQNLAVESFTGVAADESLCRSMATGSDDETAMAAGVER